MKKLKKIKLGNPKTLNEQEMKRIVGGYSGNNICGDEFLFFCLTRFDVYGSGYQSGSGEPMTHGYVCAKSDWDAVKKVTSNLEGQSGSSGWFMVSCVPKLI